MTGSDSADIASLSAFTETICAETLTVTSRFETAADPEVAAALSTGAGQRVVLKAGQYSNSGSLVIDVVKSGAVSV